MARIAGIDIPREKRVEIALTYVYGIGLTTSKLILANTGVNPDVRVKDLSDSDVQKLRVATEDYTLEGDLRRKEGMALKRLQDIGCVRGRRHRMSLPVRGQRTRTNARTRRGSRKTVAGRKKLLIFYLNNRNQLNYYGSPSKKNRFKKIKEKCTKWCSTHSKYF